MLTVGEPSVPEDPADFGATFTSTLQRGRRGSRFVRLHDLKVHDTPKKSTDHQGPRESVGVKNCAPRSPTTVFASWPHQQSIVRCSPLQKSGEIECRSRVHEKCLGGNFFPLQCPDSSCTNRMIRWDWGCKATNIDATS